MADVWLGEHKRNKRKVAIKILKASALNNADAEKLFLREGEVLASFSHPNIVTIFDNDRVGDVAYIVMELLAGGTLLDRMRAGPIMVGEALGIVVQVAGALEAAHKQQIVHRDLKPANIMLRDEATPVLTDFGAVRLLDRSTIYGKDGSIVGTPIYMSPEQITGQPLTGQSDLYALGVMFHELLTGRLPFPGGSISEIATQHLYAPVPQLPDALNMLQPVLEKLMAKQAEQRFTTAMEFIDALRRVFMSSDILRQQVGFSGTSAAWSSQLRALGFVLDPARKDEVRQAQAGNIPTHWTVPVADPEKLRRREGPKPVRLEDLAKAKPVPQPAAEHRPASGKTSAPSRGYAKMLVIALGLCALIAASWVFWSFKTQPSHDATGQAAAVSQEPPASPAKMNDVIAARDGYLAVRRKAERLVTREQLDLTSVLSRVETLSKDADAAMTHDDSDAALKAFTEASAALESGARQALSARETELAQQAQAALNKNALDEAQKLLDKGKQIRDLQQEWR